ncbi:MAG: transcriptional regulator [Acidimicrobiales bacterium]
MATLSVLPDGDTLSFTRLRDMIGLSSGNLITHLRKLEDATYIHTEKSGNGPVSCTEVVLTPIGRLALNLYKATLRDLIDGP